MLLLAFAILTMITVPALVVQAALVREGRIEGDALLGSRAELAADSTLRWFLAEGWRPGLAEGSVQAPDTLLPGEGAFQPQGELRVRHLGPSSRWPEADAWKVTARGQVRVLAGDRAVRTFTQTREAYVTTVRGTEGAPPVLRAWRIVR